MTTETIALAVGERLDPRERHARIPSHLGGLRLFLRYLPPAVDAGPHDRVVLYVHGGTFPSGLSIAHRFDGRSWRDELCAAGFHVWGLDFHGFGHLSDPYPAMRGPAEAVAPLCRAEDASRQLEHAVRFILARHKVERISIIAHSWGSIVTGRFAGRCPELVDRLVFFGPISWRPRRADPVRLPGWRLISLKDQWDRFTETVPSTAAPVLCKRHFEEWGERYLDVDPDSRHRAPASVKVPSGAFQDIFDAWAGELAYDPRQVRASVAIIRGEWDAYCTDEDARWLFDAFVGSPIKQDIKISRATHLMHLEAMRHALHRESIAFLDNSEPTPMPRTDRHREEEQAMFIVIFLVQPKSERWNDYLDLAKFLKPKLEAVEGFIDNERYESKRTKGRLLSLSTWRDEKAVVRWRSQGEHHGVQEKGRFEIFEDYHLSVGEITADTDPSKGLAVEEKRFDETSSGEAKVATIAEVTPKERAQIEPQAKMLPELLGLDVHLDGCIDVEVFESIYNPGKSLVLGLWRDARAAGKWSPGHIPEAAKVRHRHVRIIRDYGMFDRREAPQFYPEVRSSDSRMVLRVRGS